MYNIQNIARFKYRSELNNDKTKNNSTTNTVGLHFHKSVSCYFDKNSVSLNKALSILSAILNLLF